MRITPPSAMRSGPRISKRPGYVWFVSYAGIVMFFVLGGFLIAGSAVRLSLKEYFLNRFLRIMPALGVEVLLSMLIIGPIFTVLPLTTYFSDYHTWAYLTNIIGVVNYFLPGVFVNNPAPEVNNALWTIPFEYFGYVDDRSPGRCSAFSRRPALILAIAALFIATGFRPALLRLRAAGAICPGGRGSSGLLRQAVQPGDFPWSRLAPDRRVSSSASRPMPTVTGFPMNPACSSCP